jgi:hypothetical protein
MLWNMVANRLAGGDGGRGRGRVAKQVERSRSYRASEQARAGDVLNGDDEEGGWEGAEGGRRGGGGGGGTMGLGLWADNKQADEEEPGSIEAGVECQRGPTKQSQLGRLGRLGRGRGHGEGPTRASEGICRPSSTDTPPVVHRRGAPAPGADVGCFSLVAPHKGPRGRKRGKRLTHAF